MMMHLYKIYFYFPWATRIEDRRVFGCYAKTYSEAIKALKSEFPDANIDAVLDEGERK